MSYSYSGAGASTWTMLPGYKNLVVWQKAMELVVKLHENTTHFGQEYARFRGQIIDSSQSVPANIAEGYSGSSLGNYIRHCNIARGSLGELGTHIHSAERLQLLNAGALSEIIPLYSDTKFLLDRLISALRKKQADKTWDQSLALREPDPSYNIPDEVEQFHTEHFEFFHP